MELVIAALLVVLLIVLCYIAYVLSAIKSSLTGEIAEYWKQLLDAKVKASMREMLIQTQNGSSSGSSKHSITDHS